ncbi:MAG: SpoIIE family protein phosphatase [Enhydrobacter sp.]|nr:SpoIIE family protein phosphatase [Enhydrobacter sp.]
MKLFEETAPATLAGVSTLRRGLRQCLSELRLPPGAIDDLQLAVSELGANIAQHSRPCATTLQLRLAVERDLLRLDLTDDGGPFESLEQRFSDAPSARDSLQLNGMGLDFVHQSVDVLQYRPGTPNRTVLMRRLHGRRPRVLVIEDDAILRDLYGALLARHFQPLLASSLQDARDVAKANPPDLVVADLHLGDGKGSEMMTWLENQENRSPVPLVILTGDQRPAVRAALARHGVDAVLSKPVSTRELLTAVRGALARTARQQTAVLSRLGSVLQSVTQSFAATPDGAWEIAHATSAAGIGSGDIALVLDRRGFSRIVLADVMGHGLKARAFALAYAGCLRALNAVVSGGPAAFLSALNEAAFRDTALSGVFATVLALDLRADGRFRVATAGHPAPWAIERDGGLRPLAIDGAAPGLMLTAKYVEQDGVLADGERMMLITDGLDPADLSSNEQMPDWLAREVAASVSLPLRAAVEAIRTAAERQLAPEQIDDWTVLLLAPGAQPAAR